MNARKLVRTAMQRMSKLTREQLMIAVILLGVFGFVAVSGLYYKIEYVRMSNGARAQYPLKVWDSGEIIQNGDFVFRFNGARSDDQGIPHMWEIAPGQKFVMVNVSFKNTSGGVYHLSPIKTMQLKDASGRLYPVTSAPFIQNSLGGPVSPGQTVSGEIGFTVPSDAKEIQFVFDSRIPDANTIFVKFTVDAQ